MLLFPGVIDPHVHFGLRSRGTVTADDFVIGSLCAAEGGVTTVIDYADHLPGASLGESAQARMGEIQGQSCVDWTLHQNAVRVDQDLVRQLEQLGQLGVSSVKCFTTYKEADYMLAEEGLAQVVAEAAQAGLLVTVHAEDDQVLARARAAAEAAGDVGPGAHGRCRPSEAEVAAVERVIEIAARAEGPVYFVHVSTAGAAQAIERARGRGQAVFAETCPHYLLLDESAYAGAEARRFIMSPPLRGREHGRALWRALAAGAIDCISTDHCAYTLEQKELGQTCFEVLPGIPGVHTSLMLMGSYGVAPRRLSLARLAQVMCEAPARLFGLGRKGRIAPGFDADMVLMEPCMPRPLVGAELGSAAGYTPFEGIDVCCRVRRTYVRGRLVAADGRSGQALLEMVRAGLLDGEVQGEQDVAGPGWGKFIAASISSGTGDWR